MAWCGLSPRWTYVTCRAAAARKALQQDQDGLPGSGMRMPCVRLASRILRSGEACGRSPTDLCVSVACVRPYGHARVAARCTSARACGAGRAADSPVGCRLWFVR